MHQNQRSTLKLLAFLIVLPVLILSVSSLGAMPASAQETENVNIYYFWGEGCPACAQASPVLKSIADQNPRVILHSFEIYHDQENLDLFFVFGEAYGMEPRGVPTIFVANRHWVGYSVDIKAQIENTIDACLSAPCPDLGRELISLDEVAGTDTDQETPATRSLATTALIISGVAFGIVLLLLVIIRVVLPKFNR